MTPPIVRFISNTMKPSNTHCAARETCIYNSDVLS